MMDFEDQLAATGCAMTPAEFRRAVLDTFGDMYEPGELEEILTDQGCMTCFASFVYEDEPGCDPVPPEFIAETLGRLLSGDPDTLTPTEVSEVGSYYARQKDRGDAEVERMVKMMHERFGAESLEALPEGVRERIVFDDKGEPRVETDKGNPFDTRVN